MEAGEIKQLPNTIQIVKVQPGFLVCQLMYRQCYHLGPRLRCRTVDMNGQNKRELYLLNCFTKKFFGLELKQVHSHTWSLLLKNYLKVANNMCLYISCLTTLWKECFVTCLVPTPNRLSKNGLRMLWIHQLLLEGSCQFAEGKPYSSWNEVFLDLTDSWERSFVPPLPAE